MQIYEVPVGTLRLANTQESDAYRLSAMGCHTVVRRWEVVEAIRSERAKYLAAGIAMGTAFFFLLWAALL